MADAQMSLPKGKALAHTLHRHIVRCESAYMYRRTWWLIAWYYLNGYRRFSALDPTTGRVTPHFLDKDGDLEYQSQELLYQINQVAGRIQSMDLRPKIDQAGFTLAGQRNRAIAQIVADATVSDDQVRQASEDFAFTYACLGFAGVTGHITDHPVIGLTGDLEVIHPRELFPFPLVGQDHTKIRGLVRQRWVPLSYLKKVYGSSKISANMDELDWYEVDPGEAWQDRDQLNQTAWHNTRTMPMGSPSAESVDKEYQGIVRVRELWLYGPRETCTRYACVSGEVVLQDDDTEGMEVYCPIGWSRFMNNGSFHGAGMFDLLFSQHRQLERMTKELYNNIIEQDKYGIVVFPQGQINQNNVLRDVGRGLRSMFWDPDPVAEGFNPFVIQPHNTGDVPGRVAQFAREGLAAVNPIQDLIKEKGRVDSANGLAFLDEQITKALTSPTAGVQKAWGTMYRSLTQKALHQLVFSKKTVPVGSLTLDLAGAIIDPETNAISFADNPLPDISRLSFNIREISPRSVVARKAEMTQLWQFGIITDPTAFKLQAIKEGLDFPIWTDEEAPAYEMGIRAILTLFNDGQSPGRIILTPATCKPEIVSRLATAFMCGPAMQQASPSVVDAFSLFRETLISYMGLTLPAATPNMDDLNMLSQFGFPAPPIGGGPDSPNGGLMGGGAPMLSSPMVGPPM